jgi:beta-glucanase (GH16 family)
MRHAALAALLLALPGPSHATGSAPPRAGVQFVSAAVRTEDRGSWSLVWSDEFDGPAGAAPDSAKWAYDAGGDGWGNAELETYCAPDSSAPCDPAFPNAYRDGLGRLVIAARRDDAGRWTSARLKTIGLKTFEYGRVETSMRLPDGAGLWPAFWMLGSDIQSAGWPACGEIDIMENVPGDVPGGLGLDAVQSTLHGPGYSGVDGYGRAVRLPAGSRVDDGFHVYGAMWSPGRVEFYVDDPSRVFFVATREGIPAGTKWAFDHPFFILMNLAVGGSWPGDPSPRTPNPANLLVDYVRVYRMDDVLPR